jgi:hypothetical protein
LSTITPQHFCVFPLTARASNNIASKCVATQVHAAASQRVWYNYCHPISIRAPMSGSFLVFYYLPCVCKLRFCCSHARLCAEFIGAAAPDVKRRSPTPRHGRSKHLLVRLNMRVLHALVVHVLFERVSVLCPAARRQTFLSLLEDAIRVCKLCMNFARRL